MMNKKEVMNSIGYYHMSTEHGFEVWRNAEGHEIVFDLKRNTVLKVCRYDKGWFTKEEIEAIDTII